MTSTTIDAGGPGLLAGEAAGPLEQRHLQYAYYRAVAEGSKVTGRTGTSPLPRASDGASTAWTG